MRLSSDNLRISGEIPRIHLQINIWRINSRMERLFDTDFKFATMKLGKLLSKIKIDNMSE